MTLQDHSNLSEKTRGGGGDLINTQYNFLHLEKKVGAAECFNLVEKGVARTKTQKLMSDKFKLGSAFQK